MIAGQDSKGVIEKADDGFRIPEKALPGVGRRGESVLIHPIKVQGIAGDVVAGNQKVIGGEAGEPKDSHRRIGQSQFALSKA